MKKNEQEFDFCFLQKIKIKAIIIKAIREKKSPHLIKEILMAQPDLNQADRGVCLKKIANSIDSIIWEIWNQEKPIY